LSRFSLTYGTLRISAHAVWKNSAVQARELGDMFPSASLLLAAAALGLPPLPLPFSRGGSESSRCTRMIKPSNSLLSKMPVPSTSASRKSSFTVRRMSALPLAW
jgi:hypothetical protein